MKCVQCGKGTPDAEGRCPVCGGLTNAGSHTESEGMAAFNRRVEQTVQFLRDRGATLLSVELDHLTNDEYQIVLDLYRRIASIAGINFDGATDQYWVIQCWLTGDETPAEIAPATTENERKQNTTIT